MMSKIFHLYTMVILLLVGCSSNEQQNSIDNEQNAPNDQGNEELEVIAENLEAPWSIEKHENTFYLTERPGTIVKIENGEMDRQSVELKKELSTGSEEGQMGLVLTPDFQKSNLAYAYYTFEDSSGQYNRIVTLRLEGEELASR